MRDGGAMWGVPSRDVRAPAHLVQTQQVLTLWVRPVGCSLFYAACAHAGYKHLWRATFGMQPVGCSLLGTACGVQPVGSIHSVVHDMPPSKTDVCEGLT